MHCLKLLSYFLISAILTIAACTRLTAEGAICIKMANISIRVIVKENSHTKSKVFTSKSTSRCNRMHSVVSIFCCARLEIFRYHFYPNLWISQYRARCNTNKKTQTIPYTSPLTFQCKILLNVEILQALSGLFVLCCS